MAELGPELVASMAAFVRCSLQRQGEANVGGKLAPGMEPDKANAMVVAAGAEAMRSSGSELSSKAGHGGALWREWQSEGERGESEWELRGIPIA
jgi:hypothetical protein